MLKVDAEELFEFSGNVVELLLAQRGERAQPEGLVHDDVRVREIATDAVRLTQHVRLLGKVPCEKEPGPNPALVEEIQEIHAFNSGRRFQNDRETEP